MGSKATWNSLWVFERAENNRYKRMFFLNFSLECCSILKPKHLNNVQIPNNMQLERKKPAICA